MSQLSFVADDTNEALVVTAPIDYAAAFDELVGAGDYRYPDPDITADRFWSRGDRTSTLSFRLLALLGPGRMSTDAVSRVIGDLGFRPATFLETLTVAKARPDLPLDGRIAALGSEWAQQSGGGVVRRYALIQRFNGRRYLDLHPYHFPWQPGDQFLVAPRDTGAA